MTEQAESHAARRYSSQVRDEQARRTRQAVVIAARELFLAQGYAATTIDAIAEAAHVSRRTVFNSAGGKFVLLKLAFEWAIVGDDEPVALADRAEVKAVRAEQDPCRALMGWAQLVSNVSARVAPISEVAAVAADSDPAAAELLASFDRSRMLGAAEFIEHLASLGDGLAPGVTQQQAADVCWALMDGHVYRRLVSDRGWTAAQFTQWLYQSVAAIVLPPALRTAGLDGTARAEP